MAVLLNNILFYFGLLLLLSCSQTTKEYTFAEDVAPVIFNNCSTCHHKGGAAPFAMVKYQDVAKRAKMIAHVTQSGYMPPWPADIEYSHFIGEKTLTDSEKSILLDWYLQGSLPGDTANLLDFKPTSPLKYIRRTRFGS